MGSWLGVSNRSIVLSLPQAAQPTFSPAAGSYAVAQSVSISSTDPGASLYCTVDGTTPSFPIAGTTFLYTGPISVGTSETIKAIGVASGFANSSVGGAPYTIGALSFDRFISPNGDDNNDGLTPATAWSIGALTSKQANYRGLRIGMIGDVGGVQTSIQQDSAGGIVTSIYSRLMTINGNNQSAAYMINGGAGVGAETQLISCTSAGVAQRGWCVIDGSQPGTGTLPIGAFAIIMGQPVFGVQQPLHYGFTILDGLVVKNGNYAAVNFGDIGASVINGVIVKNCEIGPCVNATTDENPGGLFLGNCTGAQVLNCKIHDCTNTSGDVWGMGGITTYKNHGLIVTNCTIYKCGYSIQNKDTNQDGTYSYNYLDNGNFGSAANVAGGQSPSAIMACIPGTGATLTAHHNIIIGNGYRGFGEEGLKVSGAADFHNNTFYSPTTPPQGSVAAYWDTLAGAGPFKWHNNIVLYQTYATNQGTWTGTVCWVPPNGLVTTDVTHNYYGTGMNFGNASGPLSYATWQGLGFDASSAIGATPFITTPSALNINSFAITGIALTTGIGGTPCGALDGSGPVGCNF